MVAIFAFEDGDQQNSRVLNDRPSSSSSQQNSPLQEKEWPRLGGMLKSPTSGISLLDVPVPHRTSGTAKGGLALLLANSRPSSRTPSDAGDIVAERAAEAPAKARGRKKKSKKKAVNKAAAVNTPRLERPDFLASLPREMKKKNSINTLKDGFSTMRTNSARYDTDHFVKRAPVSSSASACSSPPRSVLSSLLSQAHPGDVVTFQGSDTAASSEYGEDPLVAYEIAIDEDYIAKDVDSRSTSRAPSLSRKRKMSSDDFEPLKCLGKGAYGTVLLVRHKATGRLYAQKQLKKATLVIHKNVVEQTKTERHILESVSHPNVVKLYYAFQDHEKLYLILEYAEGGELFHHLAGIKMFCEDAAAFYVAQLVLALSHLHLNVGVVYRDLKPENCLLDATGNLLLTDFGLSKVSSSDSRCSSLLGTPGYMAPEVLSDDGREYGFEVDWWGVGILSYELLTGNLPFEGNSPEKVKQKIRKNKIPLPSYLSADAKDFITRLLRKEPHKRLGYNLDHDLPIIKKHRFFRKIDWAMLERRELCPPINPLVTDPLLAENFSQEFTELPLSPVVASGFALCGGDPFKGFSFVATGLLEMEMQREERWAVRG